jgi:hypothetical protein
VPSIGGSYGFPTRPLSMNENVDIGTVELKDYNSETRTSVGAGTAAHALRVTIASDQAAFPVTTGEQTGSFTERSGFIAAGGTSQQLAAANSSRKKIVIQNPLTAAGQNIAASESLYIRFGASAAGIDDGTSIEIPSGGSYISEPDFESTQAIQVNATTTNHRWIADEA